MYCICVHACIYLYIHVYYCVLFGFDAHYIWLWLCYLLVFIDLYIMVVLIIMSYYYIIMLWFIGVNIKNNYTPFTRDGLLPMILGEVLANSMGKSNILREGSGQLYSQRPLFQWPSWHATKWQKPKKHQCFSKIRQKDGVSSLAEIALARKAHSG